MNICFFIGSLYGGGAERVVCNLANFLVKKDYNVSILTMSDKQSYYIDKRVRWIKLLQENERKGKLYNNLLRLYRFYSFLKKTRIDVYIGFLPITLIMMLLFKWVTKSKVICSERNAPSTYPILLRIILKCIAHKSDGWVFQTQYEREWYGNSIGKAEVQIIPNAINPDVYSSMYIGKRKNKIVTVGKMTKQKNQVLMIKAFNRIHHLFPEYKLIIFGEGILRDNLQKIIDKLQLSEYIEMPGYVNNIYECIKDASLFVLSSDYEGIPNALIEAMALGLPCIATDCKGGGVKSLINNRENGLIVPARDEKSLANAMKSMLLNYSFADQCGKKAHSIIERLSPDVIYEKWEHFINHIANK